MQNWINSKIQIFSKDKKELQHIIKDQIENEGPECDLNDIYTTNITDMSWLFHYMKTFNGNISNWDVSNVTDMSHMFDSAESFNGNISKWNVSRIKDMTRMFYDAHNFNQPIGS